MVSEVAVRETQKMLLSVEMRPHFVTKFDNVEKSFFLTFTSSFVKLRFADSFMTKF